MNSKTPTLNRRSAVVAAGTVGALAAVAAALRPAAGPQPEQAAAATPPNTEAGTAGYQLTEHIRKYYATART